MKSVFCAIYRLFLELLNLRLRKKISVNITCNHYNYNYNIIFFGLLFPCLTLPIITGLHDGFVFVLINMVTYVHPDI